MISRGFWLYYFPESRYKGGQTAFRLPTRYNPVM
jgi:hypothetical protein